VDRISASRQRTLIMDTIKTSAVDHTVALIVENASRREPGPCAGRYVQARMLQWT
jgi:hypothetical protein